MKRYGNCCCLSTNQNQNKPLKMTSSSTNFTLDQLEFLKTSIETFSHTNQVEILRILHDTGVKLNPSKFGIYVNFTALSSDILDTIMKKVEFIIARERTLSDFENKTAEYKTMTGMNFGKEDKEKMLEFPIRDSISV